jgi:hypothetical protein
MTILVGQPVSFAMPFFIPLPTQVKSEELRVKEGRGGLYS